MDQHYASITKWLLHCFVAELCVSLPSHHPELDICIIIVVRRVCVEIVYVLVHWCTRMMIHSKQYKRVMNWCCATKSVMCPALASMWLRFHFVAAERIQSILSLFFLLPRWNIYNSENSVSAMKRSISVSLLAACIIQMYLLFWFGSSFYFSGSKLALHIACCTLSNAIAFIQIKNCPKSKSKNKKTRKKVFEQI